MGDNRKPNFACTRNDDYNTPICAWEFLLSELACVPRKLKCFCACLNGPCERSSMASKVYRQPLTTLGHYLWKFHDYPGTKLLVKGRGTTMYSIFLLLTENLCAP